MGAAYDAQCENEGLQSLLNKKNRQIREQKKLTTELAECLEKYMNEYGIEGNVDIYMKVRSVLDKPTKKKKK